MDRNRIEDDPARFIPFVPSCLRAYVPTCLRAYVPTCPRAFVPTCLALLYRVPPMATITLTNLTKRFGETTAVDAVDLTVPAGQLFFLLGPSGCGKTTLLRMLAGFIEPTAGRIALDQKDVTNLPPNRRNTGMVFQSYALWPHMTVRENVAYGLVVRKIKPAERRKRALQALETVQMQHLADRKPNQLSGGQQQRVALARALVIKPTVLLLDEPLSNLDAKLRLEMRTEIKRICKQTQITTVYVTHDQKEALSMADQVAVLREGKVAQVGDPQHIYGRPASRFVADFLGETNFLSAVVNGTEGNALRLDTPAGPLLSTALTDETPAHGNVTCSIRPEALRIVDKPPEQNALTGRRVQTIFLGEMAQHIIELPDETIIKVFELNPKHFAAPGSAECKGEPMHLHIAPEHVVVLND